MAEPARKLPFEEDEKSYDWRPEVIPGSGEGGEAPNQEPLTVARPEGNVYDQEQEGVIRPDLRAVPGVGVSDGKKRGDLKAVDRDDISEKEQAAASGSETSIGGREQSFLDRVQAKTAQTRADRNARLGRGFRNEGKSRAQRFLGQFTRKRIVTGAVISIVGGSGFAGFAVLQGPFQFIHYAQTLQKHFRSNEDFGDDRTMRTMFYALAGKGQESRLGLAANKVANVYERKFFDETGLKPAYCAGFRRLCGFHVADRNRYEKLFGDIADSNGKNARKIDELVGKGADLKTGDGSIVSADGTKLGNDDHFIDIRDLGSGERRTLVKTLGKATKTNSAASAIGSRLLIKRGGVKFHVLNKAIDWRDQKIVESFKKKQADDARDGTHTTDEFDNENTKDTDGNGELDSPNDEQIKTSNDTKDFIKEFKESGAFKTASSAAVTVGVMCAARSYGDSIEDYKYQNNILPMMRMGFSDIAIGNQIMSNDDFNLGTLGAMSQSLYDKKANTSWTQAASIRAGEGKTGGVEVPPEADLRNATDKPKLFDILEKVPLLKTACGVQSGIFGLPIIKQVSDAISSVSQGAMDTVLKGFGTSTDELFAASLKAVAGRSVDTDAKGALRGALSDTGTFLAANDQAMSMGGKNLTPGERANLALLEEQDEKRENSQKSIADRYLNLYNSDSVASTVLDATPNNANQFAMSIGNPAHIFASSFSGISSLFFQKTSAQTINSYDYGRPKIGFSLTEQNNPDFENPYENATHPLPDGGPSIEDDLPRLNKEFGEKCFGVTVTADDSGVHVETKDKSEMLAVYKNFQNDPVCDATKNTSDRFNHYRMYIADAITVVSLNCNNGDDQACQELGMGNTGGTPQDTSDGVASNGDLEKNKDKFTNGTIYKLPSGTVGPPAIGFYHQCQDERWANKAYPYASGGSNTICASACGPSSLAMVISTLSDKIINPYEVAQKVKQYHVSGGTDMNGAINLVESYGLSFKKLGGAGDVKDVLKRGGFVIMSANASSPFTQAGHFIVIRAVSEDGTKFYVADPADDNGNGQNRSEKPWPVSAINPWTSTGLWGVEKK